MRTFSRADWDAAQAAWADGEFSDEWKEVRHQAALRRMLFPPTGSALDSWDEDQPSQRAILIRAIRETPDLLRFSIATSRSWGEVIAKVIRQRDVQRGGSVERDTWDRTTRQDEPTGHEATVVLKRLLDRIGAS